MAPLKWSETDIETRIAIWTHWLEGQKVGQIVKSLKGTVTTPAVVRILKRMAPPEEIVQNKSIVTEFRYMAITVDGPSNPWTEGSCMFLMIKYPERIGTGFLFQGIRDIGDLLEEFGGDRREFCRTFAHTSVDLFLDAVEAGVPAFQLDLAGRAFRMVFDESPDDPDPGLIPVPPRRRRGRSAQTANIR